jgi:flagellar assembly factor FliW
MDSASSVEGHPAALAPAVEIATLAVRSRRFGALDVPLERVFTLDPGLVGFPSARRFVLLDARPGSPFKWMLCIDEPELAFAVVDPCDFVPGYASPVEHAARVLRCKAEDVALLALVTIPERPTEIFVNLLAPVVVDLRRRAGRQLVLEDPTLDPAHRIALT